MPRQLISASIALLITSVGLVGYWIVFMPWLLIPGVISPWPKLVLALIEVALAIYFLTRWRRWPAFLLLVGSIPMLLVNISMCGWEWRMQGIYGPSPSGDSALLAFLFPSDNEHSPVNAILHYSIFLSMVCLPIAFFWYFFRLFDRHLTMRSRQPLTRAKIST
jgi:hypothetical protein